MKTLLILITAFLTFNAFGTSLKNPYMMAQLENPEVWIIDESLGNIHDGEIEVDVFGKQAKWTITLSYYASPFCPEGAVCALGIWRQEIKLPVTDYKMDACGIQYYKAQRDMMPADGLRQEIVVTDYSRNKCMHISVNLHTMIDYIVQFYSWQDGKIITQKAKLFASELN